MRAPGLAAWAPPLLLVALVLGAWGVGAAALLIPLFPIGAALTGGMLYRRPAAFVAFTWWIWFLTPEVRRLIDHQVGWNPQNPVMLAPYLVTGLCALALLQLPKRAPGSGAFPYVLAGAGVVYAYCVGLFTAGPAAATYDLLAWITPVLFGLYLASHPADGAAIWAATRRTAGWAAGLLGLYGIVQFVQPPAWDQYWMLHVPMASIGQPEPFEVRVFSTLNSPSPFGVMMMACLLVLLGSPGRGRHMAGVLGLAGLLLSLVRSAWGGLIVGVGLLAVTAKGPTRFRLGLGLALSLALLVPLASMEPFASVIGGRLETIGNLGDDLSMRERLDFYGRFAEAAFFSPLGWGLGSVGLASKLGGDAALLDFDSGLMNLFLVLGWPGATLYLAGMAMILFRAGSAPWRPVAIAVAVALLTQLPFFNALVGVCGLLLWGFLALAAAPAPAAAPFAPRLGRADTPDRAGMPSAPWTKRGTTLEPGID